MKFYRKLLTNGMILLFEQREIPVVSVSISNPYGAIYENESLKGISHFMEHLVFTGTKTRTHEDISREIEKRGGMLNAFTSQEVTSFLFKLPSEHLYLGLEILTDLLINPSFNTNKFEREKKIILEEIKLYHDSPDRAVFDLLFRKMFKEPFGLPLIGSEKSILPMERDFVSDFFFKHYSNAPYIVTIVGKADFPKLCKYFEKRFPNTAKKLAAPQVIKTRGEEIERRDGIDQAHLVLGMHAPLASEDEYTVLECLDAYLANGMSSQLFLKIREELGLAYTVQSVLQSERNYSYYGVYAGTTPQAVKKVKQLIIETLEQAQEMSEKQLDEAKERLIGLRKISSEESLKVMHELIFAEIAGDARNYYKREENYRAIKLGQVRSLAKLLFKDYSFAAIIPK